MKVMVYRKLSQQQQQKILGTPSNFLGTTYLLLYRYP